MINAVFDKNRNRLAYLDNAVQVAYSCPLNALWTASFALPADDPKNVYCAQNNFVRIFDGNDEIGLFRIVGEDKTRSDNSITAYSCEHVLSLLMDDVMFQYHQLGGVNQHTNVVINYILGQQTTQNWILDKCDFDRKFEYAFENENLLSALFAVPNCFDVEYMWTWNTATYPWRIKLETPPSDFTAEIRYAKNLIGMTKTTDSTSLANRIYALGYGEGVNQLTIKSVNDDVPYVENTESQSLYGLKSTILVDSRYQNAEALKGYALQMLAELSEPYYSYDISALDLFRLLNDYSSRFKVGDIVRVIDTQDNISLRTRVICIEKDDVDADAGSVRLTLANKDKDIASSISNLQQRARINETYSQGATNLMIQNFSDNADAIHPAEMNVYIPDEVVRINKILLNVEFQAFRGYTSAVKSYQQSTVTSSWDGAYAETTADGGTTATTSESAEVGLNNEYPSSDNENAVHNHGLHNSVKLAIWGGCDEDGKVISGGYETFIWSGAHNHGSHSHDISLGTHKHGLNIPNHQHSVIIPAHTHDIQFGIYEGNIASRARIVVDDNELPTLDNYSQIDLTNYLGIDKQTGKITRGTFHKIQIYPDGMTRIIGALFVQLFTSSQGGGDY